MKIRVTLKDPDTMHDAVREAVTAEVEANFESLSKSERNSLIDSRVEEHTDIIIKDWMRYGEYLTVEFDTEKLTATVIKRVQP